MRLRGIFYTLLLLLGHLSVPNFLADQLAQIVDFLPFFVIIVFEELYVFLYIIVDVCGFLVVIDIVVQFGFEAVFIMIGEPRLSPGYYTFGVDPESFVGFALAIYVLLHTFRIVILVESVAVSFQPHSYLVHKLDYAALMLVVLQLQYKLSLELE